MRLIWPAPFSLLALLAVCLTAPFGVQFKLRDGCVQASGRGARLLLRCLVPWMPAAGLTIGHVVLYRSHADADLLHAHEIVHVAQWARWGVLFPFAYAFASLAAYARGGHYYRDNCFEVEARQRAGF